MNKFATRKFVAATVTAIVMVACWVASNWLIQAGQNFGVLVTGLGACLTAYTAGNVVQDHVFLRAGANPPSQPDDPQGK